MEGVEAVEVKKLYAFVQAFFWTHLNWVAVGWHSTININMFYKNLMDYVVCTIHKIAFISIVIVLI